MTRFRRPGQEGFLLAVDFGTSASSGILVGPGDRTRVVKDPVSGDWRWPSAVFRHGDELLVGSAARDRRAQNPAAYLTEFKRHLGQSSPIRLGGAAYSCTNLVARLLSSFRSAAGSMLPDGASVTRLVATVPASYQAGGARWNAMLQAGADAGFTDVDLLPEPVAAGLGAAPLRLPSSGTLLVYDFGGGTFDAALLRLHQPEPGGPSAGSYGDPACPLPRVLAHAALDDCGGRDIDSGLSTVLRTLGREWAGPLLEAPGAAGLGNLLAFGEFAQRVKHRLSTVALVEDRLYPSNPLIQVTRDDIDAVAAPLIASTIACCRRLLTSTGTTAADLGAVLTTGGTTRMPAVGEALAAAFRQPVIAADDTDLAVVLGAAAWASHSGLRRLEVRVPSPAELPLAWEIPGGSARLTRWLRHVGESCHRGTVLARVRLADGALHDLPAAGPGRLLRRHASPGDLVASGDWLVTVLPPPTAEELLPRPRLRWSAAPGTTACGSVRAVVWNPDGGLIHVLSSESTLATVDAATGEERWALPGTGRGYGLAVCPGGRLVACGANDGQGRVTIADTDTAAVVWSHQTGSAVFGMAFAPDGERLAFGLGEGGVHLCDVSERGVRGGDVRLELPGWVHAVAFAPSGWAVTAVSRGRRDRRGLVRTWDLRGGTPPRDSPLDSPVETIAWSPDGGRLAAAGPGGALDSADADAAVWLWDAPAATGASGAVAEPHLVDRAERGTAPAVAFAPDGLLLAVGRRDGRVRIWSVPERTAQVAFDAGAGVRSLAFSPDGHSLAVATENGLTVWGLSAAPQGRHPTTARSPR